jgi:hypothetical protein
MNERPLTGWVKPLRNGENGRFSAVQREMNERSSCTLFPAQSRAIRQCIFGKF